MNAELKAIETPTEVHTKWKRAIILIFQYKILLEVLTLPAGDQRHRQYHHVCRPDN